MDFFLRACFLVVCLATSGCVAPQHYWGNYSPELYEFYKSPSPEQRAELQDELARIFARAEVKGVLPAPGLYAEYGTLLMESEDYPGAIEYYEKERAAWPESRTLMDALISSLQRQLPEPEEAPATLNEGATNE